MRFIDGKQGDIQALEQCLGARLGQPFRGDIEQIQLPGLQPPFDFACFLGRHAGIQKGRFDAQLVQGVHLVLHQRDQRRYDDADAWLEQRRYLVAQGFAATGRHQHQCIMAVQQMADDFLLLPAELIIAENSLEDL